MRARRGPCCRGPVWTASAKPACKPHTPRLRPNWERPLCSSGHVTAHLSSKSPQSPNLKREIDGKTVCRVFLSHCSGRGSGRKDKCLHATPTWKLSRAGRRLADGVLGWRRNQESDGRTEGRTRHFLAGNVFVYLN